MPSYTSNAKSNKNSKLPRKKLSYIALIKAKGRCECVLCVVYDYHHPKYFNGQFYFRNTEYYNTALNIRISNEMSGNSSSLNLVESLSMRLQDIRETLLTISAWNSLHEMISRV
ncbi:hypothetical protein M0804_008116 [Polistes exclamans]|nr:hypothetical protein M0804_008116 [Polistes exclamans]